MASDRRSDVPAFLELLPTESVQHQHDRLAAPRTGSGIQSGRERSTPRPEQRRHDPANVGPVVVGKDREVGRFGHACTSPSPASAPGQANRPIDSVTRCWWYSVDALRWAACECRPEAIMRVERCCRSHFATTKRDRRRSATSPSGPRCRSRTSSRFCSPSRAPDSFDPSEEWAAATCSARPADEILLSEIVSAVDGPITLGDFGEPHADGACDHEGQCVLLAIWKQAGEVMQPISTGSHWRRSPTSPAATLPGPPSHS